MGIDSAASETGAPNPGRRDFIKKGMVAGAAVWTAPIIFDSVFSPAGATTELLNTDVVNTYIRSLPAGRTVSYVLRGGGGAGGNGGYYSGRHGAAGGSGTTITGTFPSGAGGTLTAVVGAGGVASTGGAGGAGGNGNPKGGKGGNESWNRAAPAGGGGWGQ